MNTPNIIISQQDMNRIETLLEHQVTSSSVMVQLEQELARAEVVAPQAVPQNVVSMNSVVKFTVLPRREQFEKRLVYPHELTQYPHSVSILTPIGSALLGMQEGSMIDWMQPTGQIMHIVIDQIVYQPEREGVYI